MLNQSGVSGLLGFFDTLNKGKEESQQRRNKTLELGLGFAKEQKEFARQEAADKRIKEQDVNAKRAADQAYDIGALQLKEAKALPYKTAMASRQGVITAEQSDLAKLPELTKKYSLEKTPAGRAAIEGEIAFIKANITKRKKEYERTLDAFDLTPDQRANLLNFDYTEPLSQDKLSSLVQEQTPLQPQGQVGMGMGGNSIYGGDTGGVGSRVESIGQPIPYQSLLGQTPQEQDSVLIPNAPPPVSGAQTVQQGGVAQPAIAGGITQPQKPQMNPELLAFLQANGISGGLVNPSTGLSSEEHKAVADALASRKYSTQVTGADLPDMEFDPKLGGLPRPESIPTQVNMNKMVTRLLPDIRRTLISIARRENVSLDDVQSDLFGEDESAWILNADGTQKNPASMEPVIGALGQYVSLDPKDMAALTGPAIEVSRARYAALEKRADKLNSNAEAALDRANRITVANIGARGQVNAAGRAYDSQQASAAQDQIQTSVRSITAEGEAILEASRAEKPDDYVRIGIAPANAVNGLPIEIMREVSSTLFGGIQSALRVGYDPSVAVKNPRAIVNTMNKQVLVEKVKAYTAGITKSVAWEGAQAHASGSPDTTVSDHFTSLKNDAVKRLKAMGLDPTGKPLQGR